MSPSLSHSVLLTLAASLYLTQQHVDATATKLAAPTDASGNPTAYPGVNLIAEINRIGFSPDTDVGHYFSMSTGTIANPVNIPQGITTTLVPLQSGTDFLASSQGQTYTIPSITFLQTGADGTVEPTNSVFAAIANVVYQTTVNVQSIVTQTTNALFVYNAGSTIITDTTTLQDSTAIIHDLGGFANDASTGMATNILNLGSNSQLALLGPGTAYIGNVSSIGKNSEIWVSNNVQLYGNLGAATLQLRNKFNSTSIFYVPANTMLTTTNINDPDNLKSPTVVANGVLRLTGGGSYINHVVNEGGSLQLINQGRTQLTNVVVRSGGSLVIASPGPNTLFNGLGLAAGSQIIFYTPSTLSVNSTGTILKFAQQMTTAQFAAFQCSIRVIDPQGNFVLLYNANNADTAAHANGNVAFSNSAGMIFNVLKAPYTAGTDPTATTAPTLSNSNKFQTNSARGMSSTATLAMTAVGVLGAALMM